MSALICGRVRGSPTRRVLCLIRHPKKALGAISLSRLCDAPLFEYTSNLQELMGLPKFLTHLFLHATACGLRRVFTSLPITDDLVLPSVIVETLGTRNKLYFEAVPALQGTRLPLRPAGFSVYASPVLFTGDLPTPPHAQDSIRVGG